MMEEQIKMDGRQLRELLKIVNEIEKNIITYTDYAKNGNQDGLHKDWYKGKLEAYQRSRTLLNRFLRWNGYIDEQK